MSNPTVERIKLRFIQPMYALAANGLPESSEWIYEVKLDGYRCLAGRDSTSVTLWSRRGNVFTLQFPAIARAFEALEPGTLLDGEIVAIDESARSSFNMLQHHRSKASALRFYAFDLLYDRGQSLLKIPLSRRRELLKKVVTSLKDPILLSEAFDAEPSELLRSAKELALEGVIAKRKDSFYEPGKRSGAWVKYRINQGQEFVIGGYVPDHPFDSIIVGYYQDGKLYYAAKVRNGFVPHVRREVFQRLKGLDIDSAEKPLIHENSR
jgi:DNA ligase D-like protein (predicted ligase)